MEGGENMGIWSSFKEALNRNKEEQQQSYKPPESGIFTFDSSNILNAFNWDTGTPSIKTHAVVYAAISRLSTSVARLPLKLYEETDQDLKEVKTDLTRLLTTRPCRQMTAFIFWRTIEAQRNMYGNAYAFIKRNKWGDIEELQIMDPQRVEPIISREDGDLYYQIHVDDFGTTWVHNLDVLHFPALFTKDYKGVPPLRALFDQLGHNKAMQEYSRQQIEKSIKVSGIVKLAAHLKPESILEYQKQFSKMYTENWKSILVLEKGMEFEQFKFNPQDLKLLENNRVTVQQVAMAFNLPPSFLGDMERATYSNYEQQALDYVQNTMVPIAQMYEQELNYKLLSDRQRARGKYFKFNVNSILRGDSATRANFYEVMIRNGLMTINEARKLEELPPVKDGDKNFVTLNYAAVTGNGQQKLKGGENNEQGQTDGKED